MRDNGKELKAHMPEVWRSSNSAHSRWGVQPEGGSPMNLMRSFFPRKKEHLIQGVGLLFLCLTPLPVRAEIFFDIYAGQAEVADTTVSASLQEGIAILGGTQVRASRRTSFDTSAVFGLRGGYWSESYPWLGAALDLSHFEAKGEGVEIKVTPLSGLVMLRYPLVVSQAFPKGRIQPYAGLGASFASTSFKLDFRPELPETIDENGFGIGPDFRAGLAWRLSERIAVFGEYRYWQANLEVEDEGEEIFNVFGPAREGKAKIRTNQVFGGLSLRF